MSPPDGPGAYPSRWEADVVLSDGATIHVRPIRPDDAAGIEALHARLSPESIYFRFFTPITRLTPAMLERFTTVDYVERMALVGVLGSDLVAVARYEALPVGAGGERDAEVAFLVGDDHQGRGVGSILLEHLVATGRAAGITRFVADTLPENGRMLRVFHDAGFDDVRTFADGVVRVAFPIAPTEASHAAADERGRRAAAASIRRLLAPVGVAVVGASTRTGTLGHLLLRCVLDADPAVAVYPVHPSATSIGGLAAYRSVLDIPDRVDLAVVVAPAGAVAAIADECARKHVAGLVVISAGFAERDAEGAAAERALVTSARRQGMRLIGPNCMGVANTDPAVRLNATLSPTPPTGGIGIIASSGGLGVVILDEVARRGLGVSTFVSVGNKADVSGNDLLAYWEDDPRTDVVCMYIESFGSPRTFSRLARRVSARKPIVAVKSGRSAAGRRAAGVQRVAQDDLLVDALFRQAGVIRTDTLEELLDVCGILACQPLPAGNRVGIVGDNGGPGVLAADACVSAGLDVVALDPATVGRLEVLLPGRSLAANPVGLPADIGPGEYAAVLDALLGDPGIDAVIALYGSPLAAPLAEVAGGIAAVAADHPSSTLLACVLGHRGVLDGGAGLPAIPSFAFPESAARALGAVVAYAAWRARQPGTAVAVAAAAVDSGARVVQRALAAGPGWLAAADLAELLAAYGVDVATAEPVTSAAGAVEAAGRIGWPVVLRADPRSGSGTPGATHVRVGLDDAAAVTSAWAALGGGEVDVVVQAMVAPGLDVVVGVEQDPLFGSLVTLGRSAGTGVAPRRRSARSTPLTDVDVAAVVDETDDGWSDAERRAVAGVVARVGALAEHLPEVVELELNPVIVGADGTTATGARARVAPYEPRPELALRRLV